MVKRVDRLTKTKNNGLIDCAEQDICSHEVNCNECEQWIFIAEKLAAYEDTGLTPEQVVGLINFKKYWDSLYGQGLEIANWHLNGTTEPFDNFFDSAESEMQGV